jgi:hypothetical protein
MNPESSESGFWGYRRPLLIRANDQISTHLKSELLLDPLIAAKRRSTTWSSERVVPKRAQIQNSTWNTIATATFPLSANYSDRL